MTTAQSRQPIQYEQISGEKDLVVIARDPAELVDAQHQLIARLERKREDAAFAERELAQTIDAAAGTAINVQPLKRQRKTAAQRVDYYTKLIGAMRAGYVIVPDLPGETIAVRTSRERPTRRVEVSGIRSFAERQAAAVRAQRLPAGEGRYVSGASVETETIESDEGRTHFEAMPVAFQEQLDMPAEFLKPRIIERTQEAMQLRIFDEITIVTGRVDPIVMGRILRPGSSFDAVAFVIAWFVDTADL